MLVIDAANVIGSRPDGWWRDRAGAANRLLEQIRSALEAGRLAGPVTVVLEGAARVAPDAAGIDVVRAEGSGDDAIVGIVTAGPAAEVTVVTADRGLRDRVRAAGGEVRGPGWFLSEVRAGR